LENLLCHFEPGDPADRGSHSGPVTGIFELPYVRYSLMNSITHELMNYSFTDLLITDY